MDLVQIFTLLYLTLNLELSLHTTYVYIAGFESLLTAGSQGLLPHLC